MIEFLHRVLPVGASCAAGPISQARGELFPEEKQSIARAVPARQQEYLAGRCYAREAMAGLALPPSAIVTAPSREPIWPHGLVGSISHTAGQCVAVVAHAADLLGIGVDIESDEPLPENIVRIICTPEELSVSGHLAKLHFVAKEAVYKLYFPLTQYFVDFQEVSVSFNLPASQFEAKFSDRCPALHGKRLFHGHFDTISGLHIALASLSA